MSDYDTANSIIAACTLLATKFCGSDEDELTVGDTQKATYIPLISRVRGPYGKLWTEFFPSFYGPSAKRAGHENKEGKNEDP